MKKPLVRVMKLALFSTLLFGCSLQDRILYHPDHSMPTELQMRQAGMRYWPEGADGYRGFTEDDEKSRKGTVIVLHGNAATAAGRYYYVPPFRRLGYRVILAEYPGYGKRPGKPGEKQLVADAQETVRLAAKMYGRPVYLVGESLGGAVAASAVREGLDEVDGVILVTPWDTLENVAKEKYPDFLVSLLLGDRYDTVSNLKVFAGPVAVVAAERDRIIPPHHAQAVYETFPGRKRMWTVRGSGHNDWPEFVTDQLWRSIMEFMIAGRAQPEKF